MPFNWDLEQVFLFRYPKDMCLLALFKNQLYFDKEIKRFTGLGLFYLDLCDFGIGGKLGL